MNKSIVLVIILFLCLGCFQKNETHELADLNMYIQSKQKIDSVFVSNIGQDREFLFLPFQDTLRINFTDSINDLYNIWFFSNGKQYSAGNNYQFWLRGQQIEVKGTFDKGFQLDTLIGSDIYYPSKHFQKEYSDLYRQKKSVKEIDTFLLTFTQNNLDNILSLESANYYMFKNKNDKVKLKKLQDLIAPHHPLFKNHTVLNVHASLETLLKVNHINIAKYPFVDIEGNDAIIELEPQKTYILDLWFINCLPCIKDHQKFQKNTQLLANHQIELIGLSIDDNQEEWAQFIRAKNYPWKNYRQTSYEGSLRQELLVEVFPTYFLIEGNGTILRTFHAFDDIETYLTNNP